MARPWAEPLRPSASLMCIFIRTVVPKSMPMVICVPADIFAGYYPLL